MNESIKMDTEDIRCESGYQLMNRMHANLRPKLTNLLDFIRPEIILKPEEMLEISGDSNCGKSYFLLQIISKACLPIIYGGCGSKVILIDTQQTCVHEKIVEMLMKFVGNDTKAMLEAQSNLFICKVTDPKHLEKTVTNITHLIYETPEISLICFDAIGEYYWLKADYKETMEAFIRKERKIFEKICKDFKISFIYVRAAFMKEKKGRTEVNYAIRMTPSTVVQQFKMTVEINKKCFVQNYMIDLYGLKFK